MLHVAEIATIHPVTRDCTVKMILKPFLSVGLNKLQILQNSLIQKVFAFCLWLTIKFLFWLSKGKHLDPPWSRPKTILGRRIDSVSSIVNTRDYPSFRVHFPQVQQLIKSSKCLRSNSETLWKKPIESVTFRTQVFSSIFKPTSGLFQALLFS